MAATALDRADDLAGLRDRYDLPFEVIRLDGNSGGSLPRTTPSRLRKFVEHRWDAHNARPRMNADGRTDAHRAASRLAPLIGTNPAEISVAESTSMHLFTTLLAATRLRPDRPVLAIGRDCFATDHYLARSAADFAGAELRLLESADDLATVLDEQVAVVALSHTEPASGAVGDPAAITTEVHRHGALALWDLSHSAGALNVDLHAWQADFALGCGYRYLGGGSGAPAYCFVAERHHEDLRAERTGNECCDRSTGMLNPLDGVAPSTPSMSEFLTGLSILDGVSPVALETKTTRLTELFLERLHESGTTRELEVIAPAEGRRQGSHVCLRHPDAQYVAQELLARGVVVDFAEPDVLRFSFAPAWLRYADVWEAVELLHRILIDFAHQAPAQ